MRNMLARNVNPDTLSVRYHVARLLSRSMFEFIVRLPHGIRLCGARSYEADRTALVRCERRQAGGVGVSPTLPSPGGVGASGLDCCVLKA